MLMCGKVANNNFDGQFHYSVQKKVQALVYNACTHFITYETIFVLGLINSDIVTKYSNYKRKTLILLDIYLQ